MKLCEIGLFCILLPIFMMSSPVSGQSRDASDTTSTANSFDAMGHSKSADSVLTDSQAVKLAYNYLLEHHAVWAGGDSTIAVKPQHVTGGGGRSGRFRSVVFGQYYRDIRVFNGRLYVSVYNTGALRDINNHLVYGIEVDTKPVVSSDEGYQTVLENAKGLEENQIKDYSGELVIFSPDEDSSGILCWMFTISTLDPNVGWVCFVDATSGEIRDCIVERDA